MAQTFGIAKLSGSTDGKGIKVAATATAGTLIHTGVAGTTDIDFLTLWANNENTSGVTRTLTLEWGGASVPDNTKTFSISAKVGDVLLCEHLPIQNGLVVRAFADVANEVVIYGPVRTARG